MHLPQYKLCASNTELALEVKFNSAFTELTSNGYAGLPDQSPFSRHQVCGHKWVDLSEHDWGVAVITDSKYGYSTFGNTMNVSLYVRLAFAPEIS